MIPKQTYELVEITKFGLFEATPISCDHCGKTICNIATIKGKQDGKLYKVGLTCVKKLLKQTVVFSTEDQGELERQEYLFDQAMRNRKWFDKKCKEHAGIITGIRVYEFDSSLEGMRMFYVEAQGKHFGKSDFPLFSTGAMELRFKPFFKNIEIWNGEK